MSTLEFVTYSDWAQLPDSANELFDRRVKDSLFFSRPWFEHLAANALESDQHLVLACVLNGTRVRAILPLLAGSKEVWSALSSSFYTSLYTLLLDDHDQPAVVACLARGLAELPLTSLRLIPVDPGDQNLEKLRQQMEVSGFTCHRRFAIYNWVHHCRDQSYADYLASRPGQVRNTVNRKRRKLAREHDFDIRLYRRGDLEQALADYKTVYRASWKADERFSDFSGSLVRQLSQLGWLRLAILYVGEQPVAAQIWFVVHRRASIFRLAYDPSWKHYSPGSILTAYLMEHVIDTDGVEEVDFLTGNERYKQDWMSERRERWAVTLHRPAPAAQPASLLTAMTRLFKR